jgi:hypothetical protein
MIHKALNIYSLDVQILEYLLKLLWDFNLDKFLSIETLLIKLNYLISTHCLSFNTQLKFLKFKTLSLQDITVVVV